MQKNGPPGKGRHEGLVPRNDVLTNGFIRFSLARTQAPARRGWIFVLRVFDCNEECWFFFLHRKSLNKHKFKKLWITFSEKNYVYRNIKYITCEISRPSPPSWKFYIHNATQSQCAHRLARTLAPILFVPSLRPTPPPRQKPRNPVGVANLKKAICVVRSDSIIGVIL